MVIVGKQDFRALKKLTDRPLEWNWAYGPREQAWVVHYLWTVGALQVVSELVSHLGYDPRGVLGHVMVRNGDFAVCEWR